MKLSAKVLPVLLLLVFFCVGTGPVYAGAEAGLVGDWHFDGNAQDSSGFGNDGAIHGATYVEGISGQALRLDGVDDYVSVSSITLLQGMPQLTVEMWARTTDLITYSVLLHKGEAYVDLDYDINIGHASPDNRINFRVRNTLGTIVSIPADELFPTTNEWVHVAGVYDGSEVALYIDGIRQSQTASLTGNVRSTGYPFRIGSASGYPIYWNGDIDEVRIYDRALSAAEIKAEYEKYITIPATINISPDTLNLMSKGKWITAYIELPPGYDVTEIDANNVNLVVASGHTIMVDPSASATIGDYNSNGIQDLMVTFDRATVVRYLVGTVTASEAALKITGNILVGTPFVGTDTIRVINKGK